MSAGLLPQTDADVQAAWDQALARFDHTEFQPGQEQVINAAFHGKDILCIMPTLSGKSLCFQLPASVTPGVTLIISPLLSLIRNQLKLVRRHDVRVFEVVGGDSIKVRRLEKILLAPNASHLCILLYTTPEFWAQNYYMTPLIHKLHNFSRLSRIVIDEAHCIPEWGGHFRRVYSRLGDLRTLYEDVPITALTATADAKVKQQIKQSLGFIDSPEHTLEYDSVDVRYNQSNIFYWVREKCSSTVVEQIAYFIHRWHSNRRGIIYCLSRDRCDNVARVLTEWYGIAAKSYHSETNNRVGVEDDWHKGTTLKVLVATVAMGKGINQEGDQGVRFVIHETLPDTLQLYYGETGRIPRDDVPSDCVLFYNESDYKRLLDLKRKPYTQHLWKDPIDQPSELREKIAALTAVCDYCTDMYTCRRLHLLQALGNDFDGMECNEGCDICCF
jgi:bloom syndrome protein